MNENEMPEPSKALMKEIKLLAEKLAEQHMRPGTPPTVIRKFRDRLLLTARDAHLVIANACNKTWGDPRIANYISMILGRTAAGAMQIQLADDEKSAAKIGLKLLADGKKNGEDKEASE